MEKVISVRNINKKYKLYRNNKERIMDLVFPKSYGEDFFALKDVNFEAFEGDIIGFIGTNGSGKSTLSNIIAGIVPESSGYLEINGQASLIAVASGLKNDLSGRENIELKLLMLGFDRDQIKELEPQIIEYAELETFIDQPVKSYSSGMKSRLGFAISVNIDPDILIIDEALSVGDKAFANKSLNKMLEFKEKGKTMIFVSHSINQVKNFCEKVLWLEFGKVKKFGSVEDIIPQYEDFLYHWEKLSKSDRKQYRKLSIDGDVPNIYDFIPETSLNEKKESIVSLLGHVKAGESYIYKDPSDYKERENTSALKNNVYYIKKKMTYNGNPYYLLSKQPSYMNGVIGWMQKRDLSLLPHYSIDNDQKQLYLTGGGKAFNRPWGGKKNIVIDDLTILEGESFISNKTEKVGNNLWYLGRIENQLEPVWINHKHLK
ncbi:MULTISPECIES: teichoic acids export ABC transporter ATP-binding subunit TagH [Allobacillus]|uniref:Teichoic acids export ABC transporter ATP-binding subunit TagH n=1 Tax=Allobacillus salarius TaxID=1955272 RepID=A0A556PMP6_9BACI|nr:teichoic acids export ABC transporter ATP-binding subunit TagH [Allobacillus salarius]TSJ65657.1 teichoic acids export ABC transporter ATP-binding subunit TagH [Allobacillus salarius]